MMIRNDISALNASLISGTLAMLVTEWAKCSAAKIDDEGDIQIISQERSRWLDIREIEAFAIWLGEQDMDAAQARHNPRWAESKR